MAKYERNLPQSLTVGEHDVPIIVRRSKRAKYLTLRVDSASGDVILVLPQRASLAEGRRFLEDKTGWLAQQIAELPPHIPFADGAEVPLRGVHHTIRHYPALRSPAGRGPVWVDDDELWVAGDPTHLPRRLTDWYKRQANLDISHRAYGYAEQIGEPIKRIRFHDARSRWGSCTHDGVLSFSWRLIMAGEDVIEYVVAHEVAHLVEMNHSPQFWAIVSQLRPGYKKPQKWLRHNGLTLHRYG
jgi:predicted metal-dependent hydrolase